ncbi:pentapeptide repeat-containing protein [Streptomyces sp. NPDC017260]|uniref:pentapeptide repeat-containing protein n=1 Tax=unclassified Streptomyces TaxID=2593676 RepID=UPI0037A0489B
MGARQKSTDHRCLSARLPGGCRRLLPATAARGTGGPAGGRLGLGGAAGGRAPGGAGRGLPGGGLLGGGLLRGGLLRGGLLGGGRLGRALVRRARLRGALLGGTGLRGARLRRARLRRACLGRACLGRARLRRALRRRALLGGGLRSGGLLGGIPRGALRRSGALLRRTRRGRTRLGGTCRTGLLRTAAVRFAPAGGLRPVIRHPRGAPARRLLAPWLRQPGHRRSGDGHRPLHQSGDAQHPGARVHDHPPPTRRHRSQPVQRALGGPADRLGARHLPQRRCGRVQRSRERLRRLLLSHDCSSSPCACRGERMLWKPWEHHLPHFCGFPHFGHSSPRARHGLRAGARAAPGPPKDEPRPARTPNARPSPDRVG